VPFAFSTGYADHGVEKGYDYRPVLRKPYRDAELAAIVSGFVSTDDGISAPV